MREFREFCGDFEKKAEEAKMEKEALSPELMERARVKAKGLAKVNQQQYKKMLDEAAKPRKVGFGEKIFGRNPLKDKVHRMTQESKLRSASGYEQAAQKRTQQAATFKAGVKKKKSLLRKGVRALKGIFRK